MSCGGSPQKRHPAIACRRSPHSCQASCGCRNQDQQRASILLLHRAPAEVKNTGWEVCGPKCFPLRSPDCLKDSAGLKSKEWKHFRTRLGLRACTVWRRSWWEAWDPAILPNFRKRISSHHQREVLLEGKKTHQRACTEGNLPGHQVFTCIKTPNLSALPAYCLPVQNMLMYMLMSRSETFRN